MASLIFNNNRISWDIWKLAGEIGNIKIIDVLLDGANEKLMGALLKGLAFNHHNQLVDKYVSQIPRGTLSYFNHIDDLYEGIVAGDNLELFNEYQPSISNRLVYSAGFHDSEEILEKWILKILEAKDLLNVLFNGYIVGGHLEKAKRIYERLDGHVENISAIPEDCIECFLYLEEIGLINPAHITTGIRSSSDIGLTPVLKFIVERDSDYVPMLFEKLLVSDDAKGLIWLYERFHHVPEIASLINKIKMNKVHAPINRCFVRWVRNQK